MIRGFKLLLLKVIAARSKAAKGKNNVKRLLETPPKIKKHTTILVIKAEYTPAQNEFLNAFLNAIIESACVNPTPANIPTGMERL
jgi:hypothetical protein